MTYNHSNTYGRKVVKNNRNSEYHKILYLSWLVCFLVGLIVGLIVGALGIWGITSTSAETQDAETHEFNVPMFPIEEEPAPDETVKNSNVTKAVEVKDEFIPLDVPMNEELQRFVYTLCDKYDVDFPLVMALIEHESSFKNDAKSSTNDYGLMQINRINHERLTETLGVTDFLDPYQNTESGIFMLTELFEKYEDTQKVLMAYNLGESKAKRYWNEGIYQTEYSSSIVEKAAEYKQELSERGNSDVLYR